MNSMADGTNSAPLVSVLIPCWGCRDYIGKTIKSALAQDYKPLEILVVEDHGDDGTYEEALKFSDPRLRVIRNERNFGQYGNKNEAARLASGDLIKYLDGDDLLFPDCVSRLVAAWKAAGPGVGAVFARFDIIDAEDRVIATSGQWGVTGRVRGLDVLSSVTRQRKPGSRFGNVTPHLFHRSALEAIDGFPKDNAGPGDIETFMKLLCVTDVCFIADVVGSYRSRPGSMITRTFGVRECCDGIKMVDHVNAFFQTRKELPVHLRDPEFIRDWKIWAGSDNTMACLAHKLRGAPESVRPDSSGVHRTWAGQGIRPVCPTPFHPICLGYDDDEAAETSGDGPA